MAEQNNPTLTTIVVGADYLQTIYAERDEALTRNRELESQMEANRTFIKSIASHVGDLERERDELLTKVQILEEEKAGLESALSEARKNYQVLAIAHNVLTDAMEELQQLAQDWQKLLHTVDALKDDAPQEVYTALYLQWQELKDRTDTLTAGREEPKHVE